MPVAACFTWIVFAACRFHVSCFSHLKSGPWQNLGRTMGEEHCEKADSKIPFTTKNYMVTTCSSIEWWWVVDYAKVYAASNEVSHEDPNCGALGCCLALARCSRPLPTAVD